MASPAIELALYLEDQGVGVFGGTTAAAWSINVSTEPDTPNQTVTLYDQPGGGDPDTDDLDLQESLVQIRVRGDPDDYSGAYAKHEQIRGLLITPAPLITDNVHFVGVKMVGNISSVGRDGNDRHLLVASYLAQRQEL